jgi:hypothetical protein
MRLPAPQVRLDSITEASGVKRNRKSPVIGELIKRIGMY